MDSREIADRVAINEALARYCRALDTMELALITDLFTEDARISYGPDARLDSHGAAALAVALERLWRWKRTSHHLSNVEITFEGPDVAVSTSLVLAWHERPDGTTAMLYGGYDDRWRRTATGWQISERRQFMNGADGNFTVPIHPRLRRAAPEGWVAPNIDRR